MNRQDMTIHIDHVGRRGDGVGTLAGRPVFIPGALPGEVVRARVDADRGQGHAGRLLEVVTPSPERVAPPCPHYRDCGGCSLQHWSDAAYRGWTMERIGALLAREGVAVADGADPVFIPAHTRRRATMAAVKREGTVRLGFHRARSHAVADIPGCLVMTPRLMALAARLRLHLAGLLNEGRPVDIFMQDTGAALDVMITGPIGARRAPQMREREKLAALAQDCHLARLCWRFREREEEEIMASLAPVVKQSGALSVALPPGAFMQPSAAGEAALVAAVTAPLAAIRPQRIADLFAGCGTFTGPLRALAPVHAVEGDAAAVRALQDAARIVPGITAERRNLFTDPLGGRELKPYDAIVIDPPRAGALAQVTAIAGGAVPLVIMVSCNPATFARDAAALAGGGYDLQRLHVVDQFTWSAHTELVGVFVKG